MTFFLGTVLGVVLGFGLAIWVRSKYDDGQVSQEELIDSFREHEQAMKDAKEIS